MQLQGLFPKSQSKRAYTDGFSLNTRFLVSGLAKCERTVRSIHMPACFLRSLACLPGSQAGAVANTCLELMQRLSVGLPAPETTCQLRRCRRLSRMPESEWKCWTLRCLLARPRTREPHAGLATYLSNPGKETAPTQLGALRVNAAFALFARKFRNVVGPRHAQDSIF